MYAAFENIKGTVTGIIYMYLFCVGVLAPEINYHHHPICFESNCDLVVSIL